MKKHYLFHYYGLVTRDGIQVRSATFGKYSGLLYSGLLKDKYIGFKFYTQVYNHKM